MNATTSPRIYVACLASYNNGVLHGEWIDATDADTMRAAIADMLRRSPYPNVLVMCAACDGVGVRKDSRATCPACKGKGTVPSAEEWAMHDSDGFYGALGNNEYPDLDEVAELAQAIDEHGEAFALYMANMGGNNVDVDAFKDAYAGEWDSLEDFASNLIEKQGLLGDVPESLRNYIDYAAYARDLERGGDVWSGHDSSNTLHVFGNR